jgi:hypothetical protein
MSIQKQGHIHPEKAFATISQWESIAKQFLKLQAKGKDTRGGVIQSDPALGQLISRWFSFQLHVEVERFAPRITQKNVLDFIEDFVNHKVWGLRREFASYFPNVDDIKIAYFYSRFDIEPFVLLDEQFTQSLYGSTNHKVTTLRFTTKENLQKLQNSIDSGQAFDVSTFTKNWKPFFKKESNVIVKLEGDLVAAFKSDVKSIVTDKGNKAANMERLAYPGDQDNICTDLSQCEGVSTYLWNEIVMKPTRVLSYKEINKY